LFYIPINPASVSNKDRGGQIDNLDNVCKQSQAKINARHFKNRLF
jgi:hypothetical protein